MSSEKRIAANRANGRQSRGPRTAQGKARASRNALRHGLSRSLIGSPAIEQQVEEFAYQLVGGAPHIQFELAKIVGAAQCEIGRARGRRQTVLERVENGDLPTERALRELARFFRYERRAEARRQKALRRLSKLCRLPRFG